MVNEQVIIGRDNAFNNKKCVFCVSISKSGKPIKVEGSSPSDFLSALKEGSISWINFAVEDINKETDEIATSFGFSKQLISMLLSSYSSYYSAYEDLDTEMGLIVPAVRAKKLEVHSHPLMILIKKNLILTIHEGELTRLIRFYRYAGTFMKKIDPKLSLQDKITIMLTRILDENNHGNFEHLRKIEESGDEISKYLMDPTIPRTTLAPEIYKMKHALILYLDALWATLDVITSLRYGDAELITDEKTLLAKIGVLAEDVNRQISLSEHMSEVLASGLEVLQSIYNNQLQILNNRLSFVITWLTILGTALLVPNTIATIFSNPAFNLTSNDVWWYSTLLIFSTLLSTWAAYYWITKKGLMKFKVD